MMHTKQPNNWLSSPATDQVNQCVALLKSILGPDLLGIYLYGSAIAGGLQKYSDIDLFIVANRAMTDGEKKNLINDLLEISGVYMKSDKRPIELTIVIKSEINPWRYPPTFDFQYGEWLRMEFASGNIHPWTSNLMPDLAVLITQLLLSHETLYGAAPNQILCAVPYRDFIFATQDALNNLMPELHSDTRNVLLTLARIWHTLTTNTILPKPDAALWAIDHLPDTFKPVLARARSICVGETTEHWDDIKQFIQPCADCMSTEIQHQISFIEKTGYVNKSISLANIP